MLPCRVLQVDAVMREHAWQMLQRAVVQAQVPSTRACSCVPLHHTGDALVTGDDPAMLAGSCSYADGERLTHMALLCTCRQGDQRTRQEEVR